MIYARNACVDVLQTSSNWFGITYKEDKHFVQESIQSLIQLGEYPFEVGVAPAKLIKITKL